MEFLRAIALTLALITGFSVYGPREPIDLFTMYEASQVDHISSLPYHTELAAAKKAAAKSQILKTTSISKQLTEDVKDAPSDKTAETKTSNSNKTTEKTGKNSSKSSESTKKSNKEETKTSENKTTKATYFDVPLSKDLQNYIFKVCKSYDVDPSIIIAMIWKESTYRVDVMGDNGNAYGLMQIQPRWHKERMKKLGVTDLLDPYQNVLVGIDYFAELYHKKDSYTWALMAYNGGPDYANKLTKSGKVSSYASAILQKQKDLKR